MPVSVQTQNIFSDGIRDNFNFRVGLGRISELGYGMLFGSDVKKQFFQKRIKGRGYCDVGTSVISEFYTPLVPKGHDFLQEIGRLEEKGLQATKADSPTSISICRLGNIPENLRALQGL